MEFISRVPSKAIGFRVVQSGVTSPLIWDILIVTLRRSPLISFRH